MNAKPYRACNCREPSVTGPDVKRKPGKLLGKQMPEAGQRQPPRQVVGAIRSACQRGRQAPPGPARPVRQGEAGQRGAGRGAQPRSPVAAVRSRRPQQRGKRLPEASGWTWHKSPRVKPRTWESYREAFDLYWIPAWPRPYAARQTCARSPCPRRARGHAKAEQPPCRGGRPLRPGAQAGGRPRGVPRRGGATHRRASRSARLGSGGVTAPLVKALNDLMQGELSTVNPAASIGRE